MLAPLLFLTACTPETALNHHDGDGPGGAGDDWPLHQDSAVEPVAEAPGAGFPFGDDQVYELALDLPPDSVAGLVFNGPFVPGTLRFLDYETSVQVRLKGASTFQKLDKKPSLKLAFGPDDFLGVERLTLQSMVFDPTMLREGTAYRLFDEMGIAAPRHGFAHLTINGEDYGVYGLLESLDENFLDRAFPGDDDGNLYDSTFISSDLTGLGVDTFKLQEGDPATAMVDLHDLVHTIDSEGVYPALQDRFDTDSVITYMAMDLVTANWDSYSRNTNNFLLYHATVADKWYLVPWGQDTAFRGAGPVFGGLKGRLTVGCHADTACNAALTQRVHDILATWESEDLLGWATTQAAMVGPLCESDPRRQMKCDQQDLLDVLVQRPVEVRTEIGP